MDFSLSSLLAGFIFGVWGMFLIRQGRKRANPWHAGIGLALCVYPFFVEGPWLMWGIGVALMGLAYRLR